MQEKSSFFSKRILNYWSSSRRDFPWRNTSEPYFILITEILLRKTTAKQVKSVFNQFFQKYPSFDSLGDANPAELHSILTPLGMENKRTKELIKLSKIVIKDYNGKVPQECDKLLNIYGVGKYTSSAVRCLSYHINEAMVDTNVIRVIQRFFSYESNLKRVRDDPKLWKFVKEIIPTGKCKEFNLGLIDFASAICKPHNPLCQKCPINLLCYYYQKIFIIQNTE